MDIDVNSILASIPVSGIGFVAFSYGKKQHRLPQMVAGIILMVFPYFVSNVWLMFLVAAIILVVMAAAIRVGI